MSGRVVSGRDHLTPNKRGGPAGLQLIGNGDLSVMPDVPVHRRTTRIRPFPEPKPPEPSEVLVYFVDPETLQ